MKRRSLREQMMRRCVHFNGLAHRTCAAGCVYDEMDAGKRVAYRAALPCFKVDDEEAQALASAGIEQAACAHRRFPTEDELLAREQELADDADKMRKALAVVAPLREEHKGRNWSGTLDCPNCGGRLYVTHAGSNGHVSVRCSTSGCVAWME